MNSRWQASKIGLVNFWYYENRNFHLIKGRMLLRGSKTVLENPLQCRV